MEINRFWRGIFLEVVKSYINSMIQIRFFEEDIMDINISWWQLLTGWGIVRLGLAGLIALFVFFFHGKNSP